MESPSAGDAQEMTKAILAMTEEMKSNRSAMIQLGGEILSLDTNVCTLRSEVYDLEYTARSLNEASVIESQIMSIDGIVKSIRTDLSFMPSIKLLLDDIKAQNEKLCRVREAEEYIGAM